MPSDLYRRALDSLTDDERLTVLVFETWLDGFDAQVGLDSIRGRQILENLRSEAHLVGDSEFGEADVMAAFLRECASAHSGGASGGDPYLAYKGTCESRQGRGLHIPRAHLPDTLLRYSTSSFMVARMAERVLGVAAREAFQRGMMSAEEVLAEIEADWEPSRLEEGDLLGRGAVAFATFEHPDGAPRDDAVELSQALALPLWQRVRTADEILVEVGYPTDAVGNYRFPTVADAGWIHLFQPAPEREPVEGESSCYGWTEPLGGQPRQPEIVHDNAPLRVLARPPRFVGRIPL